MAEAGVGFVDILPRTDQFVTRLTSDVKSALSKVQGQTSSSFSGLTKGIQAGFVGLGVVAVAAITKGIEATVSWANQVRTLQRVTGQSAESASTFAAAADKLGIGVDKLTVGFGLLAKNVTTGNKALSEYGITTKDAQGNTLPFDDILGNIADKFQTLKPGVDQAGFAMRLFGRSGRNIIPILQQGRAGLAELRAEAEKTGLVLSQKDVDASLQLSIAQRELGDSIHGAAITLGKEFIPFATDAVKVITGLVQVVSKVPAPILATGAAIAVLSGGVAALQLIRSFFVGTWTKLLTTLHLTAPAIDEAVAAQAAATTTTTTLTEAVTALTAALTAEAGAAVEATDGLVGFGATETGLLVPTEALGAAAAATEAEVTGVGVAAGGLGALAAAALPVIGGLIGAFLLFKKSADLAHQSFQTGIANDLTLLQRGRAGARFIRDLAAGAQVQAPTPPALIPGTRRPVGEAIPFGFIARVEQAQSALAQFNEAQRLADASSKGLATSIRGLLKPLDDLQTPIADIAGLGDSLSAAVGKTSSAFDNLSQVSGQDFKSIGQGIQQALADPKTTVEQLPAIFSEALGKVREQMSAWHDQIISDFGGAQAALSDFLGQAAGAGPDKVSFANLTAALSKQRSELKRWSSDFSTILKDSGNKAKTFLQDMSANGLQSIGILDVVAQQPKKIRDQFLAQYNSVNKATGTVADQITKAFGDAADRIVLQLKNIFRAIEGLPPIRPRVDTSQANAALDALRAKILGLSGSARVDVIATGVLKPKPTATGGIIHGAAGFVTQGPVFQVGEAGRELVDPLEGDRAKRLRAQSIADALRILGVNGSQKDMRIHVTVAMDDSGNLQVRKIARDEIDREHDYRARVG